MNKAKQFGETVEGYTIPVLNEREIRASAGILYFFMFLAWMLVIFEESFFLIKFVNTHLPDRFHHTGMDQPQVFTFINHRAADRRQSNPRICRCSPKKVCLDDRPGAGLHHVRAAGCNEYL